MIGQNTKKLNIEDLCRDCGYNKLIDYVKGLGEHVENRLKMLYEYHVHGYYVEFSSREDDVILIDDRRVTIEFFDQTPLWR